MSVKPDFVNSMINIMTENNSKLAVITILEDITFLFLYNIRNTMLDKFPDLSHFNVSNFRSNTKIAVKMQVYL